MGIGKIEIKIQLVVDILDGFLCTRTVCSSDFCIRMNSQIASFQISGVRILYMTTSFFLLNEMIWLLIHLFLLFALRATIWFCFCLLKIPGRNSKSEGICHSGTHKFVEVREDLSFSGSYFYQGFFSISVYYFHILIRQKQTCFLSVKYKISYN